MPIKVAVRRITSEELKEILRYYNNNRLCPEKDAPLELLPCREGGFQIANRELQIKWFHHRIKQLRWNYNILVTYHNHLSFSKEEERLLYGAMRHVLGRENVQWYHSYSDAITSSPNFHVLQKTPTKIQINLRRSPGTPPQRSHSADSLTDFANTTNHIWNVTRIRI